MVSVLIAALISVGLAAVPHSERASASVSGCPAGTSPFEDVSPTSVAFDDVACIYRLGITRGTSGSLYSPAATVTRGQMASFLARFWLATGATCPNGSIHFTDVATSSYAYGDIGCIFNLGITEGTASDTFSPNSVVTREQMASFLARLWRSSGRTCPAGANTFDDVSKDSFAIADVACLTVLGITFGIGHGLYGPQMGVTRQQMASFLARLWRATGLSPGATVVPVRPHLAPPQPLPTTPGSTFVFEGVWTPKGPLIDGYHGVYTTVVRPSVLEPSVIVFEAWIDPMLTNLELFPGSQRPGGSWEQPNYVPADKCQSLIFAGNGGFKLARQRSRGGYYSEGRVAYPLRDGAASFVFFKDHTVDIAQWGREVGSADLTTISSVRQNLELIVDNGTVVPDLDNHYQGWWGWLVDNSAWVWRSGWGVTESGAILYVGGPGLGVRDLAERLIDGGAVRALEGDINPYWVTGNTYSTDIHGVCHGQQGLSMPQNVGGFRRPGDRYLSHDSSDFVAVFADHSRWSS